MFKYVRYHYKDYFKELFKGRKQKLLEKLREDWGKEISKKRKFDVISQYFKAISLKGRNEFIDDDTWYDLNMDKVFEKLDRCSSLIGSQILYKVLRTYNHDTERITDWSNLCELFKTEINFREKIQIKLSEFSYEQSFRSNLVGYIFDVLPAKPKYHLLIYFSALAAALSTFLMFIQPVFLFVLLFFGLINFLIKRYYDKRLYTYMFSISNFYNMFSVAKDLSTMHNELNLVQIEKLIENKKLIKEITKKLRPVIAEEKYAFNPLGIIVVYMNYFMLKDLIAFFRTVDAINANQNELAEIFAAIGELDAAISVASYLESLPQYSRPQFNSENKISVKDVYHPLLSEPVSNIFSLSDNSVLITGSNMAGKTTFMKTIATNMILAQTLNICFASEANIPQLIVKSLIKRDDNILEGASYYFKEVEKILSMVEMSKGDGKYLFVIDEIFRGTNTIERIAISSSTIKYLAANNIAMITTHDVELQDILEEEIEMYHFSEQIEDDNYFFDYKIKQGPTSSTNAIRLLEMKDFPVEITKDAYSLAESLRSLEKMK